MKIDKKGKIYFNSDELFDLIYEFGTDFKSEITLDSEDFEADLLKQVLDKKKTNAKLSIETFKDVDIEVAKKFHRDRQREWLYPEEYDEIDVREYLLSKTKTEKERERVLYELKLFEKKFGSLQILKYLMYLVDTMRKHNIVWGVGRGSSVSSYVLYLIGLHRIDPLKYNLDCEEFFKVKEETEDGSI